MLPPIGSKMRLKKITKKKLKEMVKSYRQGLDKNETKSCLLALTDIEQMIKYYSDLKNLNGENPVDGFRIYFYRPESDNRFLKVGKKNQMSIILIPTNNFDSNSSFANDMFNKNDECLVLWPGGETGGLCPTNCGGST